MWLCVTNYPRKPTTLKIAQTFINQLAKELYQSACSANPNDRHKNKRRSGWPVTNPTNAAQRVKDVIRQARKIKVAKTKVDENWKREPARDAFSTPLAGRRYFSRPPLGAEVAAWPFGQAQQPRCPRMKKIRSKKKTTFRKNNCYEGVWKSTRFLKWLKK